MIARRAALCVLALGVALSVLVSRDAATVGFATPPGPAAWTEVEWPFPIDQWGTGRAFRCGSSDCGVRVEVYVRPKIGFCNCTTGVSDDAELDRVGDVGLIGDRFAGRRAGHPVAVGWMAGRSRLFDVAPPYAEPQQVLAVAFNDKCDVIVATVVSGRDVSPEAERAALAFLNGDRALGWARMVLGL